jgi:uncharacterized protein DUF4352
MSRGAALAYGHGMRAIPTAARPIPMLGLALCLVPACTSTNDSGGTAPRAQETYPLSARTVRPDERAVRIAPAVDGDTQFTVLGISTGLAELAGSHADVKADGRFARIRLLLVNNGRTTALVNIGRQRLGTAEGGSYVPDYDAMTIKRQPLKFDVGAGMRVELDLWYDIPAGATPTGLRVYGGSTLTDLKDEQGTDLPLR